MNAAARHMYSGANMSARWSMAARPLLDRGREPVHRPHPQLVVESRGRARRVVHDPDEESWLEHVLEQRLDLDDVAAGLLGQGLEVPRRDVRVPRPDRRPTFAAPRSRWLSASTTRARAGTRPPTTPPGARRRGAWCGCRRASVSGRQIWPTGNRSAAASVRSHRSIANLADSWFQMSCSRQCDAKRPEHPNSAPSGSSRPME